MTPPLRHLVAVPATAVAAATAVVVVSATPASAHSVHYLWGDDEDLLSTTAVNQGNVVGMWQSMLDGLNVGIAVDGLYGPHTADATRNFDAETNAATGNDQVEDGDSQSWSEMGNTSVEGDSCDSSFCYYHTGVGGFSRVTSLALNRANLNWKWRSECTAGSNWHDSNHPTIDFTGGATPGPQQFVHELHAGVLCQYVVEPVVEGGRRVGLAGLVAAYQPDLANGTAWLAVAATSPHLGGGLALEGTALFVSHLFATFPLRRLYAEVPGHSFAAIASGLGRWFVEEGRLAEHSSHAGRYWPLHVLTIERTRWLDAMPPGLRAS
jgi:hypothetical protein